MQDFLSDRAENKTNSLNEKVESKKLRLAEVSPQPEKEPVQSRLLSQLDAYAAEFDARQENALASDAELGTPWGAIKQLTAKGIAAGVDVFGRIGTLPHTATTMGANDNVPDTIKDIHNRNQQYKSNLTIWNKKERALQQQFVSQEISWEDYQAKIAEVEALKSNLEKPSDDELGQLEGEAHYYDFKGNRKSFGKSYRELLELGSDAQETSQAFRDAISQQHLVNEIPERFQKYSSDAVVDQYQPNFDAASAAWENGDKETAVLEAVKGLGGLVKGYPSVIADNPLASAGALIEEGVEQGLHILTRGATLAPENLAYGSQVYSDSLQAFLDRNDGRVPTAEEDLVMKVAAMGSMSLELLGDVSLFKGLTSNKLSEGLTDATKATIEKVGGKKLLDAVQGVAGSSVTQVAGATLKGKVVEGSTELGQTYLEEGIGKFETTVPIKTGYYSAVQGASVGGGLRGAAAVATELADRAENAEEFQPKKDNKASQKLYEEALTTGDVSSLLDATDPTTFDPVRAADVLVQRSNNADLSEEDRTGATTQLNSLVSDLERGKAYLTPRATSQASLEVALERDAANISAIVSSMEEAGETVDDELRTALEDNQELQKLAADPKEAKKMLAANSRRLKAIETQLEGIHTIQDTARGFSRAESKETITDLVDQVSVPESSEVKTESSRQIIELAMRDPDVLESVDTELLINSDAFSEEEKDFFKAFTASHAERNTLQDLDSVNNNILFGTEGFKGLNEYRQAANRATYAGNSAAVQSELEGLKDFQQQHLGKAAAIKEAQEQVAATKKAAYVVRDPNAESGWVIADKAPWKNDAGRAQNGGWVVGPSTRQIAATNQLLSLMGTENTAIASVVKEIEATQKVSKAARPAPATANAKPAPAAQPNNEENVETVQGAEKGAETDLPTEEVSAPVVDVVTEATQPEEQVAESPEVTVQTDAITETLQQPEEPTELIDAGAQPEAEEQATVEEQKPKTQFTGKLSFLASSADNLIKSTIRADVFKKTNLLFAYFKQVGAKAAVPNPLVAEADYINSLASAGELNVAAISTYMPEGFVPTEKQKEFLLRFVEYYQDARVRLLENIREPVASNGKYSNPDFWHRDFMQFIRGQHPDLGDNPAATTNNFEVDENFLTALASVGFTWLSENAGGKGLLTNKEINAMLSEDEFAGMNNNKEELRRAGVRQNALAADLGKKVVKALGLKAPKEAPANVQKQFELALGNHVIGLLLQQGFVTKSEIAFPVPGEKTTKDVGFIAVTRSTEGVLHPSVAAIVDTGIGTSSILSRLFSFESGHKFPELEPGGYKQETTSTGRPISSLQREANETVADRPWEVDNTLVGALNQFDLSVVEQMVGIVPEDDFQYLPAAVRASQEAKNDDLRRGLRNFGEFTAWFSETGKDAFYLPQRVWSNQRSGIISNVVNPLTNKFHRQVINLKEARANFNPRNDKEMSGRFKLAVAQGLGIDVDKMFPEQALEVLQALRESAEVREVLSTLKSGNYQGNSELQAKVLAVVKGITVVTQDGEEKVGGEAVHTFKALLELARFEQAEQNDTDFETTLAFEVDGVTNGPMLTLVQFGIPEGNRTGEKGGFYTGNHSAQNFVEWKSEGGRDIYETLLDRTLNLIQNGNSTVGNDKLFKAKQMLEATELLALERKTFKNPLTVFIFGSSAHKAVQSIAAQNAAGSGIIDNYYAGLERAARTGDLAYAQLVVGQLNGFISDSRHKLPEPKSLEEILTKRYSITGYQEGLIADDFSEGLGAVVAAVLEEEFAGYIAARNQVIQMAEATFLRYKTARDYLIQVRYQQRLAEENNKNALGGSLAGTSKGLPQQTLPQADLDLIEELLKPLLPLVHTPLSKKSGELAAGLLLVNHEQQSVRETDQEVQAYSQLTKFGKYVPYNAHDKSSKQTASLAGRATKTVLTSPGVSPNVNLTHSLDAAISTTVYADIVALHSHDALTLGLAQMYDGAKGLNQATFEFLKDYTLAAEVFNALKRSMTGSEQLEKDFPGLSTRLNALSIKDRSNNDTGEIELNADFLETNRAFVKRLSDNKDAYVGSITTVDQYTLVGGSYNTGVTPQEEPEQTKEPETQPTANDSVWGRIGRARHPEDVVLTQALRGDTTITELLPTLRKRLAASAPNAQVKNFQLALLKQLESLVGGDLEIRFIEPDRVGTLSPRLKSGNAWYVSNETETYIGVKSAAFVNSRVQADTLLHELVHAAVAHTIADSEGQSPEQKEAVAELEALLGGAKAYIEQDPVLASRWSEATANLDEFVAWGLTDVDFQRQVLWNISVESTIGKRVQHSGMQALIHRLTKLLFGAKVSQAHERGLGQLIGNAALLMKSPNKPVNIELAHRNPHTFTSSEVFTALGEQPHHPTLDPVYQNHLHEALQTIVNTVYQGSTALKAAAEREAPVTPEDVYLTSLASGELPFASDLVKLRSSDQEAFVGESVELVMQEALERSPEIRNELYKLFLEAKERIQPEDLPEGAYETLFAVKSGEGKSHYLSRFIAGSVAYRPLHDRLAQLRAVDSEGDVRDQPNLKAKVQLLFRRLLTRLHKAFLGIRQDDPYSTAVMKLARKLATLEARNKTNLSQAISGPAALVDRAGEIGDEAVTKARKMLLKAGESPFLRKSRFALVRGTAGAIAIVAGERTNRAMDLIDDVRNRMSKGRQGLAGELYTEMRGETDSTAAAYALHIQANNNQRKATETMLTVETLIKQGFDTDLGKEDSEALTRLLRLGITDLLEDMSIGDVSVLLRDPDALASEIKRREADLARNVGDASGTLSKDHLERYFLRQAKATAFYSVTGENLSSNLMLNAYNIARLANTKNLGQVAEGDVATITSTVDALISLYALDYFTKTNKTQDTLRVSLLLDAELGNEETPVGGVEGLFLTYRDLQKDAHENEFKGDPTHMVKGYTSEIFNPYTEVVSGTAAQAKQLKETGYTQVSEDPLPKDPMDPTGEPQYLFVLRGRGLPEAVTGSFGRMSKLSKGSSIDNVLSNPLDLDYTKTNTRGLVNQTTQNKQAEINKLFVASKNWDPLRAQKTPQMAPVLDPAGRAVEYRYLMTEQVKDSLLERENRVEKVVGHMAGRAVNKKRTPLHNAKGVQMLKQMYEAEYAGRPEAFIEVSPTSTDPVIRERYRQLPLETRQAIKDVWGAERMLVRRDVYNITFGYRKFSLGEALARSFNKNPHERKAFENALVNFLSTVPIARRDGAWEPLGRGAATLLFKGERGWQELVRIVKDIWVIKNLVTLLGNIFSNFTVLFLRGINPVKAMKDTVVAYRLTYLYRNQARRRDLLQEEIRRGSLVGQALAEAKQEVTTLTDTLERNPIHTLMEAGMYQTLVEDISQEEDPYSYQSRLGEWVGAKTAWIPEQIKDAGKGILMTHDTVGYRVLNSLTTMSDFTGRYVMYKHLTERKKNALPAEEALRISREAFVNYDIPTHRGLQYLNDMGVLPFTKYYLRIQKALAEAVRSSPGRTVALTLGADMLELMPTVLESSLFVDPVPGNLSAGAFELPGAVRQLPTINWLF